MKVRQIGPRKQQLLIKIQKQLIVMSQKGMNVSAIAKFLKIPLHNLHNKYTTKQLSGVLGSLKEFANS